ncbi:carbohydrate kinase family protein [Ancrocorticia populi]|uniref:Sugar kinase n=1 Tax=Ancrocorticia populi TaxID=2175228 RepID=A0A2V1K455_9ACTO|nr:sugar kinase [Ancrocorticia populi]PWF24429.1 sugar kinase [Ancrocorticia populi]
MTPVDVICVGTSVVDIPLQPVDRTVFDSVSYPVEDVSMRVGGDALNESIVLSKLGSRVGLVSAVGADAAGEFIIQTAREAGVDVTGVSVQQRLTTSLNVGLVAPDGERTFITNRNGSLWKTEESDIDVSGFLGSPGATEETVVSAPRILAFGSIFNNPLLSGDWIARLFAAAKAVGMTICADMVPSRIGAGLDDIAEALGYVDYFFPNEDEVIDLTGARDGAEAAATLLDKGVGTVVLKTGKRGCTLFTAGQEPISIPAFVRDDLDAIDTTGAGDNFAAGFIRALVDNKTPQECAVFANAVAAVSVGGLGATSGVQSKAQVDEFLASRS